MVHSLVFWVVLVNDYLAIITNFLLFFPFICTRDLSPSSAGKRQVYIFSQQEIKMILHTRVQFFFNTFSGLHLAFLSIEERSEKKWTKAYQRPININKVHSLSIQDNIIPSVTVWLLFQTSFVCFLLPDAYVIKLFDRSVDLAQFHTGTPLYPICRAWMRNNPSVREPARSPSPPHNVVEEEVRTYSHIE